MFICKEPRGPGSSLWGLGSEGTMADMTVIPINPALRGSLLLNLPPDQLLTKPSPQREKGLIAKGENLLSQ